MARKKRAKSKPKHPLAPAVIDPKRVNQAIRDMSPEMVQAFRAATRKKE